MPPQKSLPFGRDEASIVFDQEILASVGTSLDEAVKTQPYCAEKAPMDFLRSCILIKVDASRPEVEVVYTTLKRERAVLEVWPGTKREHAVTFELPQSLKASFERGLVTDFSSKNAEKFWGDRMKKEKEKENKKELSSTISTSEPLPKVTSPSKISPEDLEKLTKAAECVTFARIEFLSFTPLSDLATQIRLFLFEAASVQTGRGRFAKSFVEAALKFSLPEASSYGNVEFLEKHMNSAGVTLETTLRANGIDITDWDIPTIIKQVFDWVKEWLKESGLPHLWSEKYADDAFEAMWKTWRTAQKDSPVALAKLQHVWKNFLVLFGKETLLMRSRIGLSQAMEWEYAGVTEATAAAEATETGAGAAGSIATEIANVLATGVGAMPYRLRQSSRVPETSTRQPLRSLELRSRV